MSRVGIMRRAPRLLFVSMLAFIGPAVFAQAPTSHADDDLDVTMRVITDPNAKAPDEIVRRIQLPKPAQQPANASEKSAQSSKPTEPGAQGQQRAAEAREKGREFGQQVSDEAKQRAEEARRNKPEPPGSPGTPGPPRPPPGRPNTTPPTPGG